jgi:hypothetical protein
MVDSDRSYFERRAAEELKAAEQATGAEAAGVHRKLSRMFSEKARALQEAQPVVPLNAARL